MIKFLVVGHPRTGTGYMSKLFKSAGYKVGHEIMEANGMSSWIASVNDTPPKNWNSLSSNEVDRLIE